MSESAKSRTSDFEINVDSNVTPADRPLVTADGDLEGIPTVTSSRSAARLAKEDPFQGVSRLGRYHLLTKLGQGGMGVVYTGYDPELDRRVALKILRKDVGSREWLLREGQALARLSHPNVIGIHEVGEQDGHVFLSMEYVEGQTLSRWLKAERRPAMEILKAFVQAGKGLMAAHAAGLVHRDFKPDNVLIGKDGRVRVGDFGIATATGTEPDQNEEDSRPPSTPGSLLVTPLTRTGSMVGTPAFMSPEQFRGDHITAWSDQWSFCVALYGATYGSSPFPAETVPALKHKVLNEPPAEPPLLPEAPLWLAPILRRGLSRDPAARFPGMAELLEAIERQLPPSPDLDPGHVLRERQIVSGLFVGTLTIYGALFLTGRGAEIFLSPAGLLRAPPGFLVVMLVLIGARWRRMVRNAYGRQLAGLSIAMSTLILLHHAVAVGLGLSGSASIIEDLIVLTVFYAVSACTMEPWLVTLATVTAIGALVGSVSPVHGPVCFGVATLVNVAAMGVRLYIDRHLRPTPAPSR